MTFVCGFPARKLLVNPARRVSYDNRITFKLFSHASDICSFHSKMSEEFLPKPACRKSYWPSEILKIIQKELFPLSHPHRFIDNLQLDTMSQTLIQNSRQRKKESDWKFHSLTFPPPPPYATAGHRKLKCWTAYGLIIKVQKAFLFRSCIYAGKKILSQNFNKFSLQILSLSLITVFTVITVYLHPEFWWSRGWGGGDCIWVCFCCSGSSCRGSLRAREQRVHGLDACCPVFDVFYLLQAQWAGDGLWGGGGGGWGGLGATDWNEGQFRSHKEATLDQLSPNFSSLDKKNQNFCH